MLNENDRCLGTPEGQKVDSEGCSIEERCPCDNNWARGQYMDCVRTGTDLMRAEGSITRNEARRLNSAAYGSECGLRRRSERNRLRDRLLGLPNLPDWLRELLLST